MKKSISVRTVILAGSLLLQLSPLCFHSRGAAGDVDLSFDPGSGVNGPVNAVVVQPDGKVIIGGQFTTVKGLARSNVARLNADGSGDSSFTAGIDGPTAVFALALQSDGKVLVGHYYGIDRLNSDGSRDTNFVASLGFVTDTDLSDYAAVRSIAVQSDGKVLIGGEFYIVNGPNWNYGVARLNSNGGLDSSFNQGLGVNGYASSVALQPDDKVLIGGSFSTVNGTNRNGIARLNAGGSLDITFNPGTGANGPVGLIALQPDGQMLIGGGFTAVNGTNRNGIARLNANGSLDGSFNPTSGGSITLQPDGKILLNGKTRLNADGSLDGSFNPGTGANGGVSSVALQPDGKVLVAGNFTLVNGTNRNNLARLNANGSLDNSFNPGSGVNDAVAKVLVQADGKVLMAGKFTTVKGVNRSAMARLHADGSGDSSFTAVNFSAYGADYLLMALQPDGKVLVGHGSGTSRLNSDGSMDSNFHPNLAVVDFGGCAPGYECFEGVVATAFAVQSDGKVLVAGYAAHEFCGEFDGCFYYYSGFVTRLNANGSRDTSFEPAIGNITSGYIDFVQSLVVQPDGKIIVAGTFSSIKGTNGVGIVRLNANGSLDNTFNPGSGIYSVGSVALQPDGKVLIGGAIPNGIARLNANGSPDGSFNPGTGAFRVWLVALQSDGKVLIGGDFTTVNGTNRNRIARLNANGSLDLSFNPGTGADALVRSIALQPDGKVLIGGDFLTVNGVVRWYVARLYGDSPAPSLRIEQSSGFVIVSWPLSAAGFVLDQSLTTTGGWSQVSFPYTTNANGISVNTSALMGNKFFRLRKL